ncbi:MAG TPA: hypothetical protein VEJ47_14560 [Candidatus Eremiobacteraceae bacterium]|nr:hypothetical protein [Candidatus Eremiobacteraceae bacterium]
MKKILAVITLIALFATVAFWMVAPRKAKAQSASAQFSRAVGVFDSTKYSAWGAFILSGNAATGSQTITACPAMLALPDGRVIQPMAPANGVYPPITIDAQTPTGYSLVSPQSGTGNVPCASLTATFANLHSPSYATSQVISGDQGVQEAINDASLNGGGLVFWQIDPGAVTLSTGGQSTSLGSVKIPTRSVVTSATARVTTTITGCTGGWSLGYSTGTEFGSANTTLTAGTTTDSSTLVPNYVFNAAATVPMAFCTTAAATAGAIHPHIVGYKLAAPAY